MPADKTYPKLNRSRVRLGWLLVSTLLMFATGLVSGSSGFWLNQVRAEGRSIVIRLPEANGSGLYGRIKLIDLGEQTRVVVAIHGVDSGEFMAHIHIGACGAYDGHPAFPLATLTPTERSRTNVELTFDQVLAGGYLVDIHWQSAAADELFDPSSAIACGELVETSAEPAAEIEESVPFEQPRNDDPYVSEGPITGIGPISDQYWSTIPVTVLASFAVLFAAMGLDLRRRAALTVARRRLQVVTRHRL